MGVQRREERENGCEEAGYPGQEGAVAGGQGGNPSGEVRLGERRSDGWMRGGRGRPPKAEGSAVA